MRKTSDIQVIVSYRSAALMKEGVDEIYCSDCVYYRPKGKHSGYCVRSTPDHEGWPTVGHSDRCGEWEHKVYTDSPCVDDYYHKYAEDDL